MFSLFVIPFCIGVVALLVISVVKYCRWIKQFDKLQQAQARKNLLSWRFVPAIWEAVREGLLHWRITKHNALLGYMHRSLAFGWFLLIAVGAVQAVVAYPGGHPLYVSIFYNFFEVQTCREKAVDSWELTVDSQSNPAVLDDQLPPVDCNPSLPNAQALSVFANVMDVLLLYVLSGLLLAMLKKVWSRPMGMRRTTRHNVVDRVAKCSLWLIFPLRLLAECHTSAIYGNGGFMTRWLGEVVRMVGGDHPIVEYQWWLYYSMALGLFFTLMPFSRYMHIFTEVLLIFFRHLGLGESTRKTGFTMYELSACSRCGICIDGCPVNEPIGTTNTQGVYLLQAIRNKDLFHRAEDIAEKCLVCHRCSTDCPVGVDLESIRRQVRISSRKATDVSGGYSYLGAVHAFNAMGRVAYFGGCMSHLTPGIGVAMKQIFDAVGQSYWHMDGEATVCCGRPLLQQGYERQARELRHKNTELLKDSGAVCLITSCPICYQSFTKEYNLHIPVLHHTEYIAQLLSEGRLRIANSGQRVAYHDPCELGRGSGIYEQPREVLRAAATLVPTPHEREHSLCCGFNLGGAVFSSEEQTKVRNAALDNLLSPNPDVIATACPMCKKAFARAEGTRVKDVAEIVAENILV